LNGPVLSGLTRAFRTSTVASLPAREHKIGAAVIDYRVLVTSLYPLKAKPGRWHAFRTVMALKEIAALGEVAFSSDELEVVQSDLTSFAVLPGSSRFLGGARLLLDAEPAEGEQELFVNYGRNFGPGTVIRISSGDLVEYNLVVAAEDGGEGRFRLVLQEPIQNSYLADVGLVEALARAPVNVNGCSSRVLVALFEGVQLANTTERVDRIEAEAIAAAVLEARPLKGIADLAALFKTLVDDGALEQADQPALLLNAENAGDSRLLFGTAPLVYHSFGTFRIDAAASENLPAVPGSPHGGREQARLFASLVSQVFSPGEQLTLLSSQLDFEEASRLSRTGRYWTTFPENLLDLDDQNQPPSRLRATLSGRFAAESGTAEPFARLAPYRKQGLRDKTAQMGEVERLLHFDGSGDPAYRSDDIDGWNVAAQGPLALPTDSELVGLVTDRGWVTPFCFEMWWRPQEVGPGTDAILFDTGDLTDKENIEITNRIFAYFDGKELVFRVADAGIPDLVGQEFPGYKNKREPSEYPQQFAQIRYGFDDGLEFDESVPYHLTFYARGTKPSDMVLFVDGVPRGRRCFQTRLGEDLHAPAGAGPFANVPGYTAGQSTKISVKDARLLPPFGVVKVDQELIEYTDRNDRELIVARSAGDAFGGRARRGSQGGKHLESEQVELYGYTGVLMSDRIPNGSNIGMRNPLGKFAVAMVDQDNVDQKEISVKFDNPTPGGSMSQPVGKGIDSSVTEIPIVPVGNPNGNQSSGGSNSGAAGLQNAFNREGGFAMLVSCPFSPPATRGSDEVSDGEARARATWTQVFRTPDEELIGLGEFIRYTSFEGGALKGVTRAPGSTKSFQWAPGPSNLTVAGEKSTSDSYLTGTHPHAHILLWYKSDEGYEKKQPVFVVPLSVKPGLGQSALVKSFAVPRRQGDYTLPEMAQIGIGFSGTASGGGTEWIRYDTIGDGCLVRDNPQRLERAVTLLGRYLTVLYTQKSSAKAPDLEALFAAVNFEDIAANKDGKDDLARDAMLDPTNLGGGILQFRGVLGTESKDHPAQARALPVIRTIRSDVNSARPGARDFVTLVDPVTKSREGQRINYGYCEQDVEGWGGAACHFAFESGVLGEYQENYIQMLSAVNPNSSSAGMALLMNANIESRELTRVLKFPSGELPAAIGEDLFLGGDMHGEASPGGGVLDEFEFFNPMTPSEVLPRHFRFILSEDDDWKGVLHVEREALQKNLWTVTGPAVETIDPVSNLPEDGVVLLIDEELIAISDIRFEEQDKVADLEVAVNGRGFLGTPIQAHTRFAPVREMTFMRVSRLEKSVPETGHSLLVADAADFPSHGVVQIGRELIGYIRKEGDLLVMPRRVDPDKKTEVGLFRGSFGTQPEAHAQGTLVYVFPARYEDRYRARADDPELAYLGVFLKARGGFYKELSWQAEQTSELADLVVEARVGGRGEFTDDPDDAKDIFLFDAQGGQELHRNELLRQGDDLELRIFVRYKDGAFDTLCFEPDPEELGRGGSNEWKRAPRLKALGVEWIASPVRLAYEEWR
ncbi:MAG: hypothetical protein V2A76_04095, partial [Planctomycetota bacterium]